MIRIGNLYVYLKNYIMKFTKLTIAFLSVFFCLVVACGTDGINDDPKTPDVAEPVTPNEPIWKISLIIICNMKATIRIGNKLIFNNAFSRKPTNFNINI